jgi:hypothetical protein
MRFAFPLKLLNRFVTYYSRLLCLLATAQMLFEHGRLRPHPSLRDYGLRFSQDTRHQRVGTDDFYRLS